MLSSMSVPPLKTGDLLLFSGQGFSSDLVRWFTGSHWTHVGLVVQLDDVEEPLLLEATRSPESVDRFAQRALAGVSLVSVPRKLSDYQGEVAVRRRFGEPLSDWHIRLAARLARRLYRRAYGNYVWRQCLDACSGARRRDYSALFCSELVAEFYRRLGWLPRDIRPGRYVPGDFAEHSFTLQSGALSAPVWIKRRQDVAVECPTAKKKHNGGCRPLKVRSNVSPKDGHPVVL